MAHNPQAHIMGDLGRIAPLIIAFVVFISSPVSLAQDAAQPEIATGIAGYWIIDDDLSDNTDDQVEVAIEAAGGTVEKRSWFRKREEDRYRGGPAEQELYDRISYDDVLRIDYSQPEFVFEYADQFTRVFHTDGRTKTTGVNSFFAEGGEDFSFANFEGDTLLVEARPRDGGYTTEVYSLEEQGTQLRVEMTIHPDSFAVPINLVRIYQRRSNP